MLALLASAAPADSEQGVLAQHPLDDDALQQWKLPGRLREISGLALTGDGRLLAVTDEAAIVYELDYEEGRLVKAFALGRPVVRDDFEGIAVRGDVVYLLASTGVIYRSPEGHDGEHVRFARHDTGLGDQCEFEGLATDDDSLLLLCKEMRQAGRALAIYSWRPEAGRIESIEGSVLPQAEILDVLDRKRIHPSGIAVDRRTGHRVIVAARQRALVEIDDKGELIDAIILPEKKKHKQAEGIELTADRELLIADEGGNDRARLAHYVPRPPSRQE